MAFFRSLLLMGLLLVLAGLPEPVLAQDRAAQARAETAVNEGRYNEALTLLRGVLAQDARNTQALLLRARAQEGRNDLALALADYQRVLQLEPGNTVAQQGLARINQRQGGTGSIGRNALDSRRRLVETNPDNLQYRLQYADALFDARQYREAAEQYGQYLDRTQGSPAIVKRHLLALANWGGDNAGAEQAAERALRRYTNDDDLYMRLGYFRLWQGKYASAQQAFEQALRLNPGNREAQSGLTQARNAPSPRTGGPSTYPIDVLTRDLRANPNQDEKRLELVDLLLRAGRYFEAKQQLDLLAPRWRNDRGWQRSYEIVNARLPRGGGPSPFLIDRLVRELRANPNQDEKRFQLAQEFIKYKRYYEAFEQLQALEKQHGETARWGSLFVQVDEGLQQAGSSPLYPIDRLTYRLRFEPTNQAVRHALADALLNAGRVAEAYDVLTDARYINPRDPDYARRLAALNEARQRLAAERITALEAKLAQTPDDALALRELTDYYLLTNRLDDARRAFESFLQRTPTPDVQLRYIDVLRVNGYTDEALEQARSLLARDPSNLAYQRSHALAAIAANKVDASVEQALERVLAQHPDDAEILLERANLRVAQGQLDEAESLMRRAQTANPAAAPRIVAMRQLIERERIRQRENRFVLQLNDARRLAAARKYPEAIAAYEDYFTARGRRTRAELKELAQVHTAAGDIVSALSILSALQMQYPEYDLAKELAKNQYYRRDYAGTLRSLDSLHQINPNDFEVTLLMADAYRELGRFRQAEALYTEAQGSRTGSQLIEERQRMLSVGSVVGLGSTEGYNFAGIMVPSTEAVVARGSGVEYTRWAQGMQTQITVPLNMVLMAGVNSHFVQGTRRLIPNDEIVRGRVNQVFGGGYVDLTPPIASDKASYTNRISFQGGLFDYEGGRTVPFGGLRYWRQEPGQYLASVGLRTTEGAIDLWSPAGGEFDLRLTQADLRFSTGSIMPDSLLRLSAWLAYNIVRDNFGTTVNNAETNTGTNIQLDASYRVLPATYLGLTYYHIGYQSTTDLYFSPSQYDTYDLWLEYEREVLNRWYFRLRGSMGVVARSRGFISRRIESDLIRRLNRHFAVVLNGSLGQSTRTLGGTTSFEDRYSTFIFSGALYWTL